MGARWLAVGGLILIVVGCESEVRLSSSTTGEREGPTALHEDLRDFAREGEWLVSPPLSVGDLDRLGVMTETTDGAPPQLRVRAGSDDRWTPMRVVFVDGWLSVSAHRFATAVSAVQLSVRVQDAERVAFLRWAATADLVPPFEDRSGAEERPLDEHLRALGVIARDGWGAQPARCGAQEIDDGRKSRVSFHHTLTPSSDGSPTMVQALQRYSTDGLGFCDGGFHFLIAPDGSVYEGRPLRFVSGHAGDEDPAGNVSIAFLGCYDSAYCGSLGGEPLSILAIDAATRLLTALALADGFGVDAGTVRGFTGCSGPSAECAGDHVLAELPGIIARAAAALPLPGGDGGVAPRPDGGPVEPPMECGAAGCDYCASKGVCLVAGESCAWRGDVGGDRCWSAFEPCGATRCWDTAMNAPSCTTGTTDEDFSSGRYGLHRYAATLPAGVPITITAERTGGSFEPALFITDSVGQVIYGGDAASLRSGVTVSAVTSGRGGSTATVSLELAASLSVRVHVLGWSSVDRGFTGTMPTDARYRLSAIQTCASMPPGPSASESVGSPSSGSLRNGVRLTPHAGYVIADTGRDAYYGTEETVRYMREGHDAVLARHPGAQRAMVRDLSILGGGARPGDWPHSSHESGRDADVTYHLRSCSATTGCPLADVPLSEFDAAATWTVFESWITRGVVTYIFVDHGLQRSLYEEAQRRGATAAQLDAWFQWPRASGVREGLIRHVANHRNHYHVRFTCPSDDRACVE